nr:MULTISPECIES: hypothetical protein [unclassified Mycobacterium]
MQNGVTGRRIYDRRSALSACVLMALTCAALVIGPICHADPPPDSDLIAPLPVVVPTPSNWAPQFPFPYNQTRASVTDADVNAERDMCQWYNAQYDVLKRQIDRLQFNRITPNGPGVINGSGSDWDYSVGNVAYQVAIVTANIDQSVAFLAPRAQALTQTQDYVGDNYFPLYQGESFFHLWQYLDAVNDGIKAHQPDWFTGPAVQRAKDWGSKINRSHVCR